MYFRGIHIITGTGTSVGKTTATAALVAQAMAAGEEPIVVKLAQTGEPEGKGALEVIRRLTGCEDLHEFARYDDALPPVFAARRVGAPELDLEETADKLRDLAADGRPVFVEGTGGVLARISNWALPQLAEELGAKVTIVTATSPGTLNAVELTLEACRARGLEITGIIGGARPEQPDAVAECVIEQLPLVTGLPVLAWLPEDAAELDREDFVGRAASWFSGSFVE
ncbi:MAG TPA: dethiobiotin synthase [Corynebacterium sp.]|uniref:ATP-dependent dethiobiotin synthetase BioD n=1 Tax=Corynebacterium sp. TaxID=1720 RepID=UPI0017D446F2|nr:ATP-dependent dethiobiotin synthetase BioD [Corynebacterium sp.]HHT32352.1 dethiobiotin synthase [Corynebacterium sp.]